MSLVWPQGTITLQAVTYLASQGKLKINMLKALAELPFEVAADAFQAAFQAEALRDVKTVDMDAALYDRATKAAAPEQALETLSRALVRPVPFSILVSVSAEV